MKIQKEVSFIIKEFSSHELQLSQNIFGLVPQSVYFNFDVDLTIDEDKHKLIYVYGLSGEGKTIFKDELKKQLIDEGYYVTDYDDIKIDENAKISEIFDLEHDKEFLVRLFSSQGLFEMRIIFSKFGELSMGQQRRVKYMYMLYSVYKSKNENRLSCVLIDEFATFLDSLSAKVMAQGTRKFMNKMLPNTLLFAFGCNDHICYTFEDLNLWLQNGKIYKIAEVTDEDRE